MIEEHSEQSYTDAGNVESSFLDSRTGDFTETYREELPLPDADAEAKEVHRLTNHEARVVIFWKRVFVVCLVVIGALASAGVYILLDNDQKERGVVTVSRIRVCGYVMAKKLEPNIVPQYRSAVYAAGDAISTSVNILYSEMQGLSDSITASADARNESFPFVTVDLFEVTASHVLEQSKSSLVFWSPIVAGTQRLRWENYSVQNQDWILESQLLGTNTSSLAQRVCPFIFDSDWDLRAPDRKPSDLADFYAPLWQSSPVSYSNLVNLDIAQSKYFNYTHWLSTSKANKGILLETFLVNDSRALDTFVSISATRIAPFSLFIEPVFSSYQNTSSSIIGFAQTTIPWDRYLQNLLSEKTSMYCVIQDCREQLFTYFLQGPKASFVGEGELHDPQYSKTALSFKVSGSVDDMSERNEAGGCDYTFIFYSSQSSNIQQIAGAPVIFSVGVATSFLVVVMSFLVYDHYVQRRNGVVGDLAKRSVKILSTLFPASVRERMFSDDMDHNAAKSGAQSSHMGTTTNLKSYLDNVEHDNEDEEQLGYAGKPIADLFPEATVMFADIAGFTAWSSVREPVQVFTLLETLYSAMDEIAQRRRVFKVETVGDCYVAVAGLPEPRQDHAVAMARFARDCLYRMRFLTRKLEASLGPDTADLCMRAGLHSGPVTAGVLRGERSRFQLFGDTMNTASRMESTGIKGRIQISQETADCLSREGKSSWFSPREVKVFAKGKGELQTYWLSLDSYGDSAGAPKLSEKHHLSDHGDDPTHVSTIELLDEPKVLTISSDRMSRLIDWNVDVLLRLLKMIVSFREARGKPVFCQVNILPRLPETKDGVGTVINEVKESIPLPYVHGKVLFPQKDLESVCLPPKVVEQLYDYVRNIAALYNDNPFHNFEHASHVTMTVAKLLSHITSPTSTDAKGKVYNDPICGITSDPLTQFSCVFSALIHDVDHSGVPNVQLAKENSPLTQFYHNQSVAEQNSVDLAWSLLMDDSYNDLRAAIYTDEAEYRLFRQLVVNAVMATDIVDKDLKALRNARWVKVFHPDKVTDDASFHDINCKATVVIEHMLQASDVAHTMQHWHIYRKWNERFFFECYKAYLEGRAEKDPAEGWYQGELGFFDFFIVPLARKVKDCGVFGISSSEYLNYAVKNRREWENKGREIVVQMVEKARREFGVKCADHYLQREKSCRTEPTSLNTTNHSLNVTSHHRYGDH